jgi:glycosyltransferase involved in cell wall biosynthesis
MKIKLYDLMGIKSGMNFYLEAFCKLLEDNEIQADILSNFGYKNKKQALPNIFEKSPLKKIFNLIVCYFKLFFAILRLKKGEFIVIELFGVIFEIPLFALARLSKKRVLLDVHEIMALDYKNNTLRKALHYCYRACHNKIIVHSVKISNALAALSNKSDILFVPLFPNFVDVNYDANELGGDLHGLFEDEATYFLFFGNIRPSKGIVDLLAATELLKSGRIKIIIAGQDIFNTIKEHKKTHLINESVVLILRLINDDEMKYLFTNSDVVLLPYESISQSGVLQSAVAFKKPLVTSDIPYFKEIINNLPSFGKYADTKNPQAFIDSLVHFAEVDIKEEFYSKADMEKYYESEKFDAFIKQLKDL